MNPRFLALSALALSPWAYLAIYAGTGLWSRAEGFGLLPFGALLFAKELVLMSGDDRRALAHDAIPGRRILTGSIVAVLLVIALVSFSGLGSTADTHRAWVAGFAGLVAVVVVARDVARFRRRSVREPRNP